MSTIGASFFLSVSLLLLNHYSGLRECAMHSVNDCKNYGTQDISVALVPGHPLAYDGRKYTVWVSTAKIFQAF